MHACHSVSVACRPAETRRRRGEIGSVHRSILVGHRRIGLKGLLSMIDEALYNPLRPVAISKLLELIGRSAYILVRWPATAPDLDVNQTAGSGGHLSM